MEDHKLDDIVAAVSSSNVGDWEVVRLLASLSDLRASRPTAPLPAGALFALLGILWRCAAKTTDDDEDVPSSLLRTPEPFTSVLGYAHWLACRARALEHLSIAASNLETAAVASHRLHRDTGLVPEDGTPFTTELHPVSLMLYGRQIELFIRVVAMLRVQLFQLRVDSHTRVSAEPSASAAYFKLVYAVVPLAALSRSAQALAEISEESYASLERLAGRVRTEYVAEKRAKFGNFAVVDATCACSLGLLDLMLRFRLALADADRDLPHQAIDAYLRLLSERRPLPRGVLVGDYSGVSDFVEPMRETERWPASVPEVEELMRLKLLAALANRDRELLSRMVSTRSENWSSFRVADETQRGIMIRMPLPNVISGINSVEDTRASVHASRASEWSGALTWLACPSSEGPGGGHFSLYRESIDHLARAWNDRARMQELRRYASDFGELLLSGGGLALVVQMIAHAHHLPDPSTVGVVAAFAGAAAQKIVQRVAHR